MCPCTSAVYVCTRPTYTAVFTAREHGAFTNGPCTRPCTRVRYRVHGRVRAVHTCTQAVFTVNNRVHCRVLGHVRAVCTQTVYTVMYTYTRPWSRPVHGRVVYTVLYSAPCTRTRSRSCTARVTRPCSRPSAPLHVHVFLRTRWIQINFI